MLKITLKLMLNSAQGENIFYQWSSRPIPEDFVSYKTAVDDWYNEIDDYSFQNPAFG